ncbi:glycine cleavage system aminomethyltransferase GcvT [Azospirillum griseum]|uniref:aminomethyltransferase n=1 Tax=Azospirillum griseum TaxID=2496639 RepID=A0A431VI30_9PROT|nr:glycine cleavage system aminomethyltransferase GcvT [Azospirillum griseum]RTR20522.1 glycine cleavage system aminomethyltransferase GcvT [Azospirillum griseum]
MTDSTEAIKTTALHALHVELGARMVPFAGYDMPVQYPLGILKEHQHTRDKAGLFDVSHMGQVRLKPIASAGVDPASALETLVPGDIKGLAVGRTRYTLFLNEQGGILDDLMVTNAGDHLFLVVNAACKEQDIAHLRGKLAGLVEVEYLADLALLALQGPMAAEVMARFVPEAATMPFMSCRSAQFNGVPVTLTRSGYTGEDGYELSCPNDAAEAIARALLAEAEVEAIGLGARDSLRLEAGLCLYGHDIDTTTTPVDGALEWTLPKRRRAEGGFPGHAIIVQQLADGASRRRVGIQPEGRQPAREHTDILDANGTKIGEITSGGFGPTAGAPVAMGYVDRAHAAVGTPLTLMVRGKPLPARVAALPFVPQRYYRG